MWRWSLGCSHWLVVGLCAWRSAMRGSRNVSRVRIRAERWWRDRLEQWRVQDAAMHWRRCLESGRSAQRRLSNVAIGVVRCVPALGLFVVAPRGLAVHVVTSHMSLLGGAAVRLYNRCIEPALPQAAVGLAVLGCP